MSESARTARRQLRKVEELLRAWDPIGVIDNLVADGLPPNEYDDYAPYILGLLHRGADLPQIASHLTHCRTVTMGVAPNVESDTDIAERLIRWWREETGPEHGVV